MQANCEKNREMNSVGVDVGKKICRASIKDNYGSVLSELSFSNNGRGVAWSV